MALSPRQQASTDLYAAIEAVEAQALHTITDMDKLKKYQRALNLIVLHLRPRLRKMAGMYASNNDIRKGDYIFHSSFGKGRVINRDDKEVYLRFKSGREGTFVLAWALTKLRRMRTCSDDIAGPKPADQVAIEQSEPVAQAASK